MAKLDWKKLEQAFRREHAETGITLLDWCRKKKINYNTARTRIKMGKIDHEIDHKTDHEIDHDISDEEPSNDACSDDEKCAKNSEKNCANSAETKRIRGSRLLLPSNAFSQRNTHAVRHRGYAKYLEADNLMDDASDMVLFDELVFTRARALSVTKALKGMFADLEEATDVETRVALYDKILKAEQALERNIARIESIERSLLTLDVLAETAPKLRADRERINAARDKLRAETDILTSQRRGVVTPVSDIVSSLHEMSNSGRLDDIPEE
ncbi:TPA: terminase [Escherichia coli]